MGHPEVVERARHRVGALLLTDHHDRAAAEAGRAADHGAVVAEEPVAAQLRPSPGDGGDHLERAGALWMPGQLDRRKGDPFAFGGLDRAAHARPE